MLHKAKPRLKCKGYNLVSRKDSLDTEYSNNFSRFGKALANGIPVLSIFALVGIVNFATNPSLQQLVDQLFSVPQCSAAENCEVWSGTCPDGYHYEGLPTCGCVADTPSEPTTPSTDATPSVSMTIDNNTIKDTIYTGRNTTAYASHTISISASNIEDYKLTLSPTKTLTGPSTIGNASGQKGSSMIADTWGYGWGATSTADSDLSYNALASSVNLAGDSVSNNKVDFSRKLAFAAKFSDNATEGTYSASVNLALTVTPQKIVAWNDMVYMQDMSAAACESVPVGTAKTLVDIRDQNSYTIKKVNEGQCWMTQNLRIVDKTISSTNSDMTSGSFTIPASSTSGFSSNTASNAYYPNDTTKGAYYTWCAATAGSCSSATSAGVNAASSICPKGWKLPVGGTGTSGTSTGATSDTKNDFMVMAGKTSTSSFTDASLVSGTNITLGTVTWPFAGYYFNSAPHNMSSNGYYWSRTAFNSTSAYDLNVNANGYVNPASSNYRYSGVSVRCVAYSS